MRWIVCLTLLWFANPIVAAPVEFTRDIKPILTKHCITCHGPHKQKGGLRLDTASAVLQGGNTGPALVAGKSGASRLVHALTGSNDVKIMPPKKPRLDAGQIAVIRAWIDQGAKAPLKEIVVETRTTSTHWAFQPIRKPAIPAVRDLPWPRNPIDRFILARLEKDNVAPSAEADRITLIRRLSLDLLGLTPTPAEVDAFVNDSHPEAYEHLVDRLLASPHYGERWGRHWLDLARYADSNGFTIDGPRTIWKYRDWVIDALNRDLPFDRFAVEQLAGDLLPNATLEQKVATGFQRNTLRNEEGGIDQEQFRVESIIDRVNTTGSVFLGLTVGCAQCHDHKFDPISQREYYRLYAFLNNCDEPTLELAMPEEVVRRNKLRARINVIDKRRRAIDPTSRGSEERWEQRLTPAVRAKLPAEIQRVLILPENGRSPEEQQTLTTYFRTLDMTRHMLGGLGSPLPFLPAAHAGAYVFRFEAEKQLAELRRQEPNIVSTLVVRERTAPRPTHVHIAGDFTRKGVPVQPGTPNVLHALRIDSAKRRPDRLDLANWIVDPHNPLTPRVVMNRFWQHYFGLGLVETENDFGTQGSLPSHLDLLDWLASEFIAQRWSMKAMHRLIVTSAAYRQSSRARPDLATLDPRNRLLARQNRLRLEAEIVRDVALAATGLLSSQVGGPSVFPPQPEGVYRFTQVPKNWKPDLGPNRFRRGLYTYFWRSAPHPSLTVFDAPDGNSTCTRRNRSNTPLQALTLLNDRACFEFAQGLTARILSDGTTRTDAERIRVAFRLLLARSPRSFEERRLLDLLAEQRAGFTASPAEAKQVTPRNFPANADAPRFAAWTMLARVLLNLDEFITRE